MAQSSSTPSLSEIISMAVEKILASVHTAMPGQIKTYDSSSQTATVQPSLQVNIGGVLQTLPPIIGVPVVFPRTASAWIRLPVAAKDQVILHFAEGCLDQWLKGDGSPTATGTPWRFQLSDCFAVPGLAPSSKKFAAKGQATSIEITNGSGWIEISPDGRFNFKNGTTDLLTVLSAIFGDLAASTAPSGGGPIVPGPSYTTDLAKLTGMKL